jgi:hypothetical protein
LITFNDVTKGITCTDRETGKTIWFPISKIHHIEEMSDGKPKIVLDGGNTFFVLNDETFEHVVSVLGDVSHRIYLSHIYTQLNHKMRHL